MIEESLKGGGEVDKAGLIDRAGTALWQIYNWRYGYPGAHACRQTLAQWERLIKLPTFPAIKKMSIVLHVRFRWLLFGNKNDEVMWIGGEKPDSLRALDDEAAWELKKWLSKLQKRFAIIARTTRDVKGIGQTEYCRRWSICVTSIRCETVPTIETAEKIARVAGLTLEEAMFAKDIEELVRTRLKRQENEGEENER